jgi:plastocyanin
MPKRKAAHTRKKGLLARRSLLLAVSVGLLLIVAVASFYAFGSDDSPKPHIRQEPVVSEEAQVTVKVVDRDYEPRELTINKGARVTWKFKGDLPHNVVDDRGAFESPILERGDEWSLTFDDPGTYTYYCTLHHSMQGTLVVLE